jgi:hypothetical protein
MGNYMWREYIPPELCFTANTSSSTVQLTKIWSPNAVTLETSTDWINWSNYTIWNTITLSNIWDKVYMRNKSATDTLFSKDTAKYYKYVMTWSISASWDLSYLLNKNGTNTIPDQCFLYIFESCSSLITPPTLPSLNLGSNCYNYMFQNCTSLTTVPELPATTLGYWCYVSMFQWCTSLETITKLPATRFTKFCYTSMFYWCSKIKLSTTQTWEYQTAYRLPYTWTWATADYALNSMFDSTWWTFTWTPTINTTYYTSNTVI